MELEFQTIVSRPPVTVQLTSCHDSYHDSGRHGTLLAERPFNLPTVCDKIHDYFHVAQVSRKEKINRLPFNKQIKKL